MIAVIERASGYTIADDGKVLGHLSDAKAETLRDALNEALRPLGPNRLSPAKYAARLKPSIHVYSAKADAA